MDTSVVTEHLKEYALYYGGGAVVLIPLIIVFRKWALPLIFFLIETIIYLVSMHLIMGGLVRIGAWFKGETSMQALRDRSAAPPWTTPMFKDIRWWDKELYEPTNVFYTECVLAVVIIIAVFKFRPLNYKKRKKRKSEIVDPKRAEEIRRARQAANREGYND